MKWGRSCSQDRPPLITPLAMTPTQPVILSAEGAKDPLSPGRKANPLDPHLAPKPVRPYLRTALKLTSSPWEA